MLTKNIEKQEKILGGNRFRTYSKEFKNAPVGADSISAQNHKENTTAHGITLIALVITIIILLILAGIVLNLSIGENGIITKAQQAGINYDEAGAREKLELALLDLQADKAVNSAYNDSTYIDNYLTKKQMTVNGNIVTVGKWQFEIDRSVPKIVTSSGGEVVEDPITELTLDKEEIMIGITNQENINIDSTAQIKVTTENISKSQYKWSIQDSNIANIDENGNITAIARGTTTIECKSKNGNKTYATCKLTVEEREYLYYKGNSIVSFDNPLCGSGCTLSGSPYFRDEYIYSKASNINKNLHQQINYLTENKLDFSKYKGLVINKKIILDGIDSGSFVRPTQDKTCNNYGLIENDLSTDQFDGWAKTIRGEEEYYDISDYNNEAYLDIVMTVGKYNSGIASVVDIYIYEIYLVK